MTPDVADPDLHELRPAPGLLLRHRGADLDVHAPGRGGGGPRVELRDGALWIRAVEGGPGVTVTHGASSIQLRSGAVVVEVHEVEALLLVAAGEAAVKGVSPLPRSVAAGQAVALTIDGTTSEPDHLSANELAADRMVVENLARDVLAGREAPLPPAPAPLEEAVDSTPRLKPRPELVLRSEVVTVRSEPSALETALANVGVDPGPRAPAVRPTNGDPIGAILEGPNGNGNGHANGRSTPVEERAEEADGDTEGDAAPERSWAVVTELEQAERRRRIVGLVVIALIIFAIIVAVALT